MTILDQMTEVMHGAAEEVVYVTPVREEEYTEPRYKKWWQGWLEFGRSEIPECIELGRQLLGRWPMPKDRWWVRRGFRRSLNEINTRRRDVEEPLPVPAEVQANFLHGLKFVGEMSWVSRPKGLLPPGSYHKVRARNADGELLFESSLTYPCLILENYTLTLTDTAVDLSW